MTTNYVDVEKWQWSSHRLSGPIMLSLLSSEIQPHEWKHYVKSWGRITKPVLHEHNTTTIQKQLHAKCLDLITNVNTALVNGVEWNKMETLVTIFVTFKSDLATLLEDIKAKMIKQKLNYNKLFTLFNKKYIIKPAMLKETIKFQTKCRFRDTYSTIDKITRSFQKPHLPAHSFTKMCKELFDNLRHIYHLNLSFLSAPMAVNQSSI